MGNCECTKCGLTAFTKCCHCRSVFANWENHIAEAIDYLGTWFKVENGKAILQWNVGIPVDDVQCLRRMVNRLALVNDSELRQAICVHEWKMTWVHHQSDVVVKLVGGNYVKENVHSKGNSYVE